jgi:hypothetical protein
MQLCRIDDEQAVSNVVIHQLLDVAECSFPVMLCSEEEWEQKLKPMTSFLAVCRRLPVCLLVCLCAGVLSPCSRLAQVDCRCVLFC